MQFRDLVRQYKVLKPEIDAGISEVLSNAKFISGPPVKELEQKLAQSRLGLQKGKLRTIRCPCCGFYLLDVVGRDHCYIRIKCNKCKFNEVIDTALFRTLRFRGQKKRLYG